MMLIMQEIKLKIKILGYVAHSLVIILSPDLTKDKMQHTTTQDETSSR